MFTEIKNVNDASKFHMTMMPQEEDFLLLDSDDEREVYAYVEEHGDIVSFSGPTIAKIARKIYEPYNLDYVKPKPECYCKIRTSSSHQFVRESIIHVDEDEMTEATLARFLRNQSINQSLFETKERESASLISPAQEYVIKKDEEKHLTYGRKRVSTSVLKKRITNSGQDQEMVLDLSTKRPSISVAAYRLKHVTTALFSEVDKQSSTSTMTCDRCSSLDTISSKDTESSCETYDLSSRTSFTRIRSGLHLKGDTPTYVSMVRPAIRDSCAISDMDVTN